MRNRSLLMLAGAVALALLVSLGGCGGGGGGESGDTVPNNWDTMNWDTGIWQ